MNFSVASSSKVFNRGVAPSAFLAEMVGWARTAPDITFEPNNKADIYHKVSAELGPFLSLRQRKAVMLEVMRVLAGFESSWDWTEGVDTSRLGADTPENAEAGAWQISYNSRKLAPELLRMCGEMAIINGTVFQRVMKFNHKFCMEYVARLMRHNTKYNGPLYKGRERDAIRKSLRCAEHSIYPWLSRAAVTEFEAALG
jgi:hypothetical protein